jgi:hypothetical protein
VLGIDGEQRGRRTVEKAHEGWVGALALSLVGGLPDGVQPPVASALTDRAHPFGWVNRHPFRGENASPGPCFEHAL